MPATTASSDRPQPEPEPQGSSEHFTRENWGLLASDPDSYKGASAEIVGKVFAQVERDPDGVYFQIWADPDNSEWNTIVAYPDPEFAVASDDYVKVRGKVRGAFEGENAFGAGITATMIEATSVQKVSATAAATSAEETLGRAQSAQGGVTVTVRKVELAADEARAFVAINNRSGYDFSFYSSSAKLIVDGQQFEPDFNFDYPEISSDISAGAFSAGVITFKGVPTDARTYRLELEGSSSNYDVGDYGTLSWRFIWQ